jgi:VWFA-related protein
MHVHQNSQRHLSFAYWLTLLLLFSVPMSVRGQAQPTPPPPPSSSGDQVTGPVIRKETKLVLVDAVVTDKKGNYIHDLTQNDFKVFEDNKEQAVSAFSTGAEATTQPNGPRHYLILFFDNSSMAAPDQIQARGAAKKFIEANAGPDRLMAIVDFGGSLRIVQNFTANAQLLSAAVSGIKTSNVDPNAQPPDATMVAANNPGAYPGLPSVGMGLSSLSNAEADFGARTMLLAIRSLAKNLRSVPGRKMLVLFSGGFPVSPENESELTATIDACNKANVAIYALDARGLFAPTPGGSATNRSTQGNAKSLSARARNSWTPRGVVPVRATSIPQGARLVLAAYPVPDPQRPGGGGGGGGGTGGGGGGAGGGGGRGGSGGGTGGGGTGGGTGGGGKGGSGGTGGTGGSGGGKGGTGGTGSGGSGGRGGSGGSGPTGPTGYMNSNYVNPMANTRSILPQFPPSAATNQQVLAALAEGTGGFTIFNTNDLLGGLERIGREQNEFYILGYSPADMPEGSCHTLKVKMNRGGMNVRARSGYCNVRTANVLEGKPVEKQLEAHAVGAQAGSIHAVMEAPFFYTAPNTARVNLAMEIPSNSFQFNKEKGKYHASLNLLGIAYRPDGSIGAKFSDTVNLDLEKDEVKEFTKSPYHYTNEFDAAPGNYKLTVVLTSGGDAFGKFETPLTIDAFDGKHLTLGGVVLSNAMSKVSEMAQNMDAALMEDRKPLVAAGMQIFPSGSNRFKHTDNVVVYSEVYEPLLTTDKPPVVASGYTIFDRGTNAKLFSSGAMRADPFIQKGNPVVPFGMKVKVDELKPGGYRLVMQAVDGANNHAPDRFVDFDITE